MKLLNEVLKEIKPAKKEEIKITNKIDNFLKIINKNLKNAEAIAEVADIRAIDEAGNKPQYWMAKAWKRERKDPERWGRRDIPVIVESKILIAMQDNFSRLKSPNLIEEKGVTRSDEGVTNEGD